MDTVTALGIPSHAINHFRLPATHDIENKQLYAHQFVPELVQAKTQEPSIQRDHTNKENGARHLLLTAAALVDVKVHP